MKKLFLIPLMLLLLAPAASAQFYPDRTKVTEAVPKTATLQSAATANGVGTAMDVSGYSTVVFDVRGTFDAQVNFQQTTNGTDWANLNVADLASDGHANSTEAAGIYRASVSGVLQVRARVINYSSGSVTVVARSTLAAGGGPTHVYGTVTSEAQTGGGQAIATEATLDAVNTKLPADPATAGNQTAEQVLVGAVNETAPASDTASSGLNGRLQRIAQRLTTLNTTQTDGSQQAIMRSGTKSTSTGAPVTSTNASATRQPLDVILYKADGTALDPTQTTVTVFPDNEPFDLARIGGFSPSAGNPLPSRLTDGTSYYKATTPADTQPVSIAATVPAQPVAGTTGGTTPCYITSAASTNATNCKASAGLLYGVEVINTTSAIYYLRLYNLASAPTCSSATGFVRTVPVPHSAGTGGGVANFYSVGETYAAGIGFCLTAGGSSTDNSNAATGVYVNLQFK